MEIVKTECIAHAKQKADGGWERPHLLEEHLMAVAKLAAGFSGAFGSAEWGYLAGIWHDLGKYQSAFQDYIRNKSGFERENAHIEHGRVTHSTAGAIHAVQTLSPVLGHVIAYLIAGHHAGLADWDGSQSSLKYRLKEGYAEYKASLLQNISSEILSGKKVDFPLCAKSKESIALWIRMLFSCLVDADFLDTERYMDSDKAKVRASSLSLVELKNAFEVKLNKLKEDAKKKAVSESNANLQSIRAEIHASCVNAAAMSPGIFSLTVPTGGGKTLSSMAFALEHAQKFNKSRIIYAIPFTSIIEQSAKVFRDFLGEESVLEHHSNLDVDLSKENNYSRLVAENWDFPLIVTTNVQLFESLFAARTSRCRKLHNLVNSVIILDEAQQLPRDFHAPITQVMQQLSDYFGVTWLLCTATQPELGQQKNAFDKELLRGLRDVREIIENPAELAEKLKRVEVEWPESDLPSSWENIAAEIAREPCVLTIVNTRKNAHTLFNLLPRDGNNLHLSANMCAEHRTQIIDEIRLRLKQRLTGDSRPLRVVSTQLIEAGVDVDFPIVYRAMSGLDSIAQSAGRCNREGKLDGMGRVVVFIPEQSAPAGFLRQGEQTTLAMLKGGLLNNSLSPEAFKNYFKQLNTQGDRDKHGICKLLTPDRPSADNPLDISFRSAAEKFKLIDDTGISVIVPFNPDPKKLAESPVEQWLAMLEQDASQKWIYRKLQRYTVSLSENVVKQMQGQGMIISKAGQWLVESSNYHLIWGVTLPDMLFTAQDSVM